MIRGASRFVPIALALAGSAAAKKKNIAARGEDLLLLDNGWVRENSVRLRAPSDLFTDVASFRMKTPRLSDSSE